MGGFLKHRMATMLVGTPRWVLDGAIFDLDFANSRYYGGLRNSLISCTRAAPAITYAQKADGTLQSFSANTPRITDLGLLVEQSRMNLLLRSNNWNLVWGVTGNITFTAAGTGPDGNTATKINAISGDQTYQDVTVTPGQTYTVSAWLWATGADIGRQVALQIRDQTTGTATGSDITLTSTPTRYSVSAAMGGATTTGRIRIIEGTTTATDCFVAFAQFELGSFPTSYIPTTSAAVTRDADRVLATGGLDTILKQQPITIYTEAGPGQPFTRLIGGEGNQAIPGAVGVSVQVYPPDLSATVGGSLSYATSSVRTVLSLTADGRTIVSEGGTEVSDANEQAANTSSYIGSSASGNEFCGFIQRIAVWNSQLSQAARLALTQ